MTKELMEEFVNLTLHHGTCDCCYKKMQLVIHIHESKDIDNIKKGDYRICQRCLNKLFNFAVKNKLL